MRMLLAVILAVLLAGCATPTTGIVNSGNGFYTVSRQGEGFWVPTETLKNAALDDANKYCESLHKSILIANVKEIPSGAFGRWPEADVVFSCR